MPLNENIEIAEFWAKWCWFRTFVLL